MNAFQLGPLVLSAPRFYAALGLGVLIIAAELTARRVRRRPDATPGVAGWDASWAWSAALAVLVASRLGYVIENLGLFAQQPVAALQFWQGGFSPWWGVAAGAVTAAAAAWRGALPARSIVLPALLSLVAWLGVPALFSPAAVGEHRLLDLTLERLEGGELELATLTGQPVVLNLWATWCLPCRRELPMMAGAANSYPDVHFVFASQAEPRQTVQRFLDELGFELRNVLLDGRSQLGNEFGSVGLPTTLFFDAEGRHVLTHVGEISSVMMINYLADLRRGTLGG